MNIYTWLEAHGYKRTGGNSRYDFYRKGSRMVIVPSDILGRILVQTIAK